MRLIKVPVVLFLVAFIVFLNKSKSIGLSLVCGERSEDSRYGGGDHWKVHYVCTCPSSRCDNHNGCHYLPSSVTDEFEPAELKANFCVVPTK